MIDKDTLRDELSRECDIIRHLATKVPQGTDDWRPSEAQRTMLELFQYLSFCGLGGARAMVEQDWTAYQELAEQSASLPRDGFDAAMERQQQALVELVDGLDQETYETQTCTVPWGAEVPLWRGLFELSYRWLAGYRMQLFLYAKQAGNHTITTPNLWIGVDWDPPEGDGDDDDDDES